MALKTNRPGWVVSQTERPARKHSDRLIYLEQVSFPLYLRADLHKRMARPLCAIWPVIPPLPTHHNLPETVDYRSLFPRQITDPHTNHETNHLLSGPLPSWRS